MNTSPGTVGSDPVILATAGYDHTVRFWQAHSGICTRTVQHQDSVSSAWAMGRVVPDRIRGGKDAALNPPGWRPRRPLLVTLLNRPSR